MTESEYDRVRPVIERATRLHASLQAKLIEKGVEPIDALLASTFAAHGLATALHGNAVTAVEWMRDALDTIERQAMAASGRGKPN